MGIINGFLINGLDCYGSNKWFMEKLGCSEQTISNAFQELEEIGEIVCTRTRTSRRVSRRINDPSQLGSRPKPVRVSDPSWFGTNASSNASNKTSEANASQSFEIVPEEVEPRTRKDTTYLRVFELWGKYPLNWKQNRTEIAAGQNILAEHGLEKAANALRFAREHADVPNCPQILKPSDLDRKWVNLLAFKGRV